jgi:hypothetical protein
LKVALSLAMAKFRLALGLCHYRWVSCYTKSDLKCFSMEMLEIESSFRYAIALNALMLECFT